MLHIVKKRGRWEEDELNLYDGFENRGKIQEIWYEAFPNEVEQENWTEFMKVFHGLHDTEKVLEECGKLDEDCTRILRESKDNPEAISEIQVYWNAISDPDKVQYYDILMGKELLRRWFAHNGTTLWY